MHTTSSFRKEQINRNWMILRNGKERGKIYFEENLKTAIPTEDYDRSKKNLENVENLND
jgi:hypothetical protein